MCACLKTPAASHVWGRLLRVTFAYTHDRFSPRAFALTFAGAAVRSCDACRSTCVIFIACMLLLCQALSLVQLTILCKPSSQNPWEDHPSEQPMIMSVVPWISMFLPLHHWETPRVRTPQALTSQGLDHRWIWTLMMIEVIRTICKKFQASKIKTSMHLFLIQMPWDLMMPLTIHSKGGCIRSKVTLSHRLNLRRCQRISIGERSSIWLLIPITKRFKAPKMR